MDNLKNSIRYLLLVSCLLTGAGHFSNVMARTSYASNHPRLYLGLAGSVLWPLLPTSMNINNGANAPSPFNNDLYSIKHESAGSLALQIAYECQTNKAWLPLYSIGLQFEHYWLSTIKGTITQYSLPQFQNYSYTWDMSSNALWLYSNLNLLRYGPLSPFITIGIGLSINNAKQFTETALKGVTPRIPPGFSDYTQYNFAYSLGIGVEYFLSSLCSISLAYNYQNLGLMRSSNGLQTWSKDYLSIKNYQINQLIFGIAYRFYS